MTKSRFLEVAYWMGRITPGLWWIGSVGRSSCSQELSPEKRWLMDATTHSGIPIAADCCYVPCSCLFSLDTAFPLHGLKHLEPYIDVCWDLQLRCGDPSSSTQWGSAAVLRKHKEEVEAEPEEESDASSMWVGMNPWPKRKAKSTLGQTLS